MDDGVSGLVSPGPEEPSLPDVCGLAGLPLAADDTLGLALPLEHRMVDVGAPEADLDGDGFMEAVTLQDERGLTVYTDVDGDGAVDHLATVRFDGSYDSWRLVNPQEGRPFGGFSNHPTYSFRDTARWECTDHGTI